ncbi:hypothetical protein, conserved [Eimeria tenella]|uniref:Phosphatidate cytidylyltransferase, mitochondrial n=1 Tax=Eimeria tenella TaxID=5802 RepID=U6KM15_EIMTE|nr:hypothetical protein, conserved [Eimeria tenella]CDJ39031.1 hypothetical protein, conserved [Eimeria tenella]|eukprot:XP_013229786.1 hypothetical protein, conserved [Eimeria tenella]
MTAANAPPGPSGGPQVLGGAPNSLGLLDVPPVDCCIYYGSNFFAQLKEKPEAPGGAFKWPRELPGEPSKGIGGPSGAPSQHRVDKGSRLGAPMADMLLLVPQKQLLQWHRENLERRVEHYAPFFKYLSRFGGPQAAAEFAVRLTKASGVPVLFNCRVPLDPNGTELCKYGVLPTEAFIEDLKFWVHFYFAGRMQKPVHLCWNDTAKGQAEVEEALHINRLNALRLALLLLPEKVTLHSLLVEIVSLSYIGDFRVLVAEDPNKVQAIVRGQAKELCAIYLPLLLQIPSVHVDQDGPHGLAQRPLTAFQRHTQPPAARAPREAGNGSAEEGAALSSILIRQDRSPAALAALYSPLPLSFRRRAEACESKM